MSAPDRSRPENALAVAERPRSLVRLMARTDKADALAGVIRAAFGLELPPPGRWAAGAEASATWVQPGGWLLESEPSAPGAFRARVAAVTDGLGAAVDQSSGASVIRLAGEPARSVLATFCRLDLHPRAFGPGFGGDDADCACRLRHPSRRRDAELRPHCRLHLRALADRGASRSLRPLWRAVRAGAQALSLRHAGLQDRCDGVASSQSALGLPNPRHSFRLRAAGRPGRCGAADLHDLDLRISRCRRRQRGDRRRGARLPLWPRT